ncbi:hypothetical protein ACFL3I_12440 [Pseudomonadota bacterium]
MINWLAVLLAGPASAQMGQLESKLSELELKLKQAESQNLDLQLIVEERKLETHRLLKAKVEQLDFVTSTTEGGDAKSDIQEPAPIQSNNEEPEVANSSVIPQKSHILVVGDARVSEKHLLGICKNCGIRPNQVRFKLEFNAFDKINFKSLSHNPNVAGILIGPLPHKIKGCDDPANILLNGDGYPPSMKVETNAGELKITKTAFRSALVTLLSIISS